MTPRWIASVALHGVVLMLILAGCLRTRDIDVQIPFVATIDHAAFSCSTPAGDFAPADLRLYLHDAALLDGSGQAVPIQLSDDDRWQRHGVALMDFEDATGHCADGTAGTHTVLTGRVPAGSYNGLRFTVGVPFDRNHADAAVADPPLNLGRMHWGWQGGYKFLRFEGATPQAAVRVHLGSTGCEGTFGNITQCSHANRAAIQLEGFVPGRNRVEIDLSALLPPRTTAAYDGAISCMSEPGDPNCRHPLAALGIDASSGAAAEAQSLFRVVSMAKAAL